MTKPFPDLVDFDFSSESGRLSRRRVVKDVEELGRLVIRTFKNKDFSFSNLTNLTNKVRFAAIFTVLTR